MSLSSETLYHRQRLYREALGEAQPSDTVSIQLLADGGLCAPSSGVYATYAFTIQKIATALDIPRELILPIPEELPG